MAEELQSLIDRIQKEAVDTGEQQAARIITQAKEKAAALIKEAEAKAASVLEKAEKDSELFAARGQQALAQASRDLLITVGRGVEKIFDQLAGQAADQALDEQGLRALLTRLVETYVKSDATGEPVEILLSPDDKAKLESYIRQRFAAELAKGVEIAADARLARGFKVRLRDRHIEHDFSREAIAEAVASFLRPALSETVYRVARETKA